MAETDGPRRGGHTGGKPVGGRVLPLPPQRPHSLQRPQQSQPRFGSQGPICILTKCNDQGLLSSSKH